MDSPWFKNQVTEWKEENPPSERATAKWYTEVRGIFADVRAKAIKHYMNERTPQADRFKQQIDTIDERDFYNKKGNYKKASRAQELINYSRK
jgi:hypothetical protein